MEQRPLVILTGPTAVGKSALAVLLARRTGGAVLSADSMQVYRHMDIGSAKLSQEEMQGVPHYLIDELEPSEEFHVVRFVKLAKKYLEAIYAKGQLPIVVGGTGFYIQALLYDIDFTEQTGDAAYRGELAALAAERGAEALHAMLEKVDPAAAEAIHPHNQKRLIRALEFYHLSGRRISEHNAAERQRQSPYNFAYFVLNDDRERLYEKIDRRVDAMLQQGLLAEVRGLREMGCTADSVSMQGLGYKELLRYLDGAYSLEEAVRIIKRDTRHFAKRQLTWFRRERDVIWLEKESFEYDEERIVAEMLRILRSKGILSAEEKVR